ncbi:ArdC-like ssDNA-binding domain-containing protein [Alicyclobacillus fodiniaquatilis]|uniref:ArdC-like ssDNA-binding domain-containing protein n=1 Tax=Alicyclobacillus fodiniaquatilis TaxID=1661150 RepID=A0ABW4JMN6_9BACL
MNKKGTQSPNKNQEALEKLEAGILSLMDSQTWKNYLRFQSKFHSYSFTNSLLIWFQKPGATYVAGFNKWKELGRHIKKGEKGIQIFAPLFRKQRTSTDDAELSLDGEPTETNNSKPAVKMLSGFRIVYVFDVSQTEGEPFEVPNLEVNILHGDCEWYEQLRSVCPFPVTEVSVEVLGGANGDFNRSTNAIRVLESLPELQKAKTLVHEWGHGLLHGKWAELPDIEKCELEAESVAFVVAQSLGFDTSTYTFGYIAGWNGEDAVERLRKSAIRIQNAADQILSALENSKPSTEQENVA